MTNVSSREELQKKWDYRTAYYKNIIKEQFQLAYFGRVDYEASSQMPVSERKYMYQLLVDQKKTEKEHAEKRAAEMAKSGKKGKKR